MADPNSAEKLGNGESCSEDKRQSKDTISDDSKKLRANASLGLSLLQAYDEDFPDDEMYSDDEDISAQDSAAMAEPSEITEEIITDTDITVDGITSQNLSSYIVEEEEIGPSVSPRDIVKSESGESSPSNSVECFRDGFIHSSTAEVTTEVVNVIKTNIVESKKQENSDDEVADAVDNVESENSVVSTDPKNHAVDETDRSSLPSQLEKSVEKIEVVTIKPVVEPSQLVAEPAIVSTAAPVAADYNFNIFGRTESRSEAPTNDVEKPESKPVKKVKLDRRRFVKSADESSNDTKQSNSNQKLSPVVGSSPLSNRDSPLTNLSPSSRDSPVSVVKIQDSSVSPGCVASSVNVTVAHTDTALTDSAVVVAPENANVEPSVCDSTDARIAETSSVCERKLDSLEVNIKHNDDVKIGDTGSVTISKSMVVKIFKDESVVAGEPISEIELRNVQFGDSESGAVSDSCKENSAPVTQDETVATSLLVDQDECGTAEPTVEASEEDLELSATADEERGSELAVEAMQVESSELRAVSSEEEFVQDTAVAAVEESLQPTAMTDQEEPSDSLIAADQEEPSDSPTAPDQQEPSDSPTAADQEESSDSPTAADQEESAFAEMTVEEDSSEVCVVLSAEQVSELPEETEAENASKSPANDEPEALDAASVDEVHSSELAVAENDLVVSEPEEYALESVGEERKPELVSGSSIEDMEEVASPQPEQVQMVESTTIIEEMEEPEPVEGVDLIEPVQSSTIEEMEEDDEPAVVDVIADKGEEIGQPVLDSESPANGSVESTSITQPSEVSVEEVEESAESTSAMPVAGVVEIDTPVEFTDTSETLPVEVPTTVEETGCELDVLSNDEEVFEDAMDTVEATERDAAAATEAAVAVVDKDVAEVEEDAVTGELERVAAVVDVDEVQSPPFEDIEADQPTAADAPAEPETEETEPETANVHEAVELTNEPKPAAKSKLEQALTGRLDRSAPEAAPPEATDGKQNIKLHLSLQGDRVSIRSSPATVATETPVGRVKRQYRKRVKNPDALEEQKDRAKEYAHRLRTRTERETPGAKKQTRKKQDSQTSDTGDARGKRRLRDEPVTGWKRRAPPDEPPTPPPHKRKALDELKSKRRPIAPPDEPPKKRKRDEPKTRRRLLEDNEESPVTVEISKTVESSVAPAGKVQPIKLKIGKNANVTIQCTTPTYGPATIERVGGGGPKAEKKIVGMLEEARKNAAAVSTYMEQATCSWSGPDLQRVERLLKESNITITPVVSGREGSPQATSVLTPILEKSGQPKPPTESPPPPATVTPIKMKAEVEQPAQPPQPKARNLNVILKPLDVEDEIQRWKITKPGSEFDITPIPAGGGKLVDVKSEIRKKIASTERRKLDAGDTEVEMVAETPPKTARAMPSLLPIGTHSQEAAAPPTIAVEHPVSHTAPVTVQPAVSEEASPAAAPVPQPVAVQVPAAAPVQVSAAVQVQMPVPVPAPMMAAAPVEELPSEMAPPAKEEPDDEDEDEVTSVSEVVAKNECVEQEPDDEDEEEVAKTTSTSAAADSSPPPPPPPRPPMPKLPVISFASLPPMPQMPTELFPKKRGRPTKAMVAAREAYRLRQEELDRLRMLQLKAEKLARGEQWEEPAQETSQVHTSEGSEPSTPTDSKMRRGRKLKPERGEKKDSDDLSVDDRPMDPEREAEEMKRLEEERARKEEERERKNELRRLKARERSDLVKAKRLRQKLKAKERHKMAQELRRQQLEEKKRLEEQLKRLPHSMHGFDDETRMSAENSQAANMSFFIGMMDDESSGAGYDSSQKAKKSRLEMTDADSQYLMVDQIAEYQWPIQGGELYMIQEQVSNFLGVKSFKRKYPDIKRRPVDLEERAYLVDSGLVSETLCDLGLTAVCSAEVLDIMCSDFPDRYEEFRKYMRDKQMKELSFKQKAWANGLGYKLLMADGSKQDLKKRAMEAASNWNSALNKSRSEDRRCYMDLQTFIVHYPKTKGQKMSMPTPKIGSYPVSILPGQFCDYYKEYTSTELRYMPVNTVLYGPLKHPATAHPGDGSQTDSDDTSSSDDSSTTSEDTQATEDTLEDIEKDMSLDETADKFAGAADSTTGIFFDDSKDQVKLELLNGSFAGNDGSLKGLCKVCSGDPMRNKMNVPEVLLSCSQCEAMNHPTCLDLGLNMVPQLKSYNWQCPDCKSCARCEENTDEDKMLFCDTCDRGYHIYCVGLKKVPAGNWQCQECSLVGTNINSVGGIKKERGLIEITS